MVGAEHRVEGGVGVVGHVTADPAVIVVVGLLVQAVEVEGTVGVQAVLLGRVEHRDVGPRITGHALWLAEGGELQGIHHLLLENPAHAEQTGALRTRVVTVGVEQPVALHIPAVHPFDRTAGAHFRTTILGGRVAQGVGPGFAGVGVHIGFIEKSLGRPAWGLPSTLASSAIQSQ